jgi:Mycobacterium membrane protein
MAFTGVLKRGWIPLAVIACGGFAVSRVRSGFGSEKPSACSNSTVTGTVFALKSVVYQVFGPVGTVADISNFDVNSEPHRVGRARLPWSLQITANVPAVISNVVAQGDSNRLAAGSW